MLFFGLLMAAAFRASAQDGMLDMSCEYLDQNTVDDVFSDGEFRFGRRYTGVVTSCTISYTASVSQIVPYAVNFTVTGCSRNGINCPPCNDWYPTGQTYMQTFAVASEELLTSPVGWDPHNPFNGRSWAITCGGVDAALIGGIIGGLVVVACIGGGVHMMQQNSKRQNQAPSLGMMRAQAAMQPQPQAAMQPAFSSQPQPQVQAAPVQPQYAAQPAQQPQAQQPQYAAQPAQQPQPNFSGQPLAVQWMYLDQNNQPQGPVDQAVLAGWLQAGQVPPTIQVCQVGSQQYAPAGSIPALVPPVFNLPAPQPPTFAV